jgi:CheY-like chemotaxis protein
LLSLAGRLLTYLRTTYTGASLIPDAGPLSVWLARKKSPMTVKRVLVLDANPALQSHLSTYLEALDPSVITKTWGQEEPWRPPLMTKRLLVADDESVVRNLLQKYLEALGHVVETAKDGQEVLRKLDHNDYDAVVTDYHMPVVDGLAVLKHIQDGHPALAAVLITGDRSHWIVERALALGAWACLFKPFHPRDLGQALKWW